jgi:hypothetical protein
MMEPRLNEPAAAKYMKIPAYSLRRLRLAGDGPKHIKINNRPYYEREDLDKFLESVTVEASK